jgi:hypothetical protein
MASRGDSQRAVRLCIPVSDVAVNHKHREWGIFLRRDFFTNLRLVLDFAVRTAEGFFSGTSPTALSNQNASGIIAPAKDHYPSYIPKLIPSHQSGSRYTPLSSNGRHDPLSTSSRTRRPNDNRSPRPDGTNSGAAAGAAADAGLHVRTIKEWLATRVRGPGILDLHVSLLLKGDLSPVLYAIAVLRLLLMFGFVFPVHGLGSAVDETWDKDARSLRCETATRRSLLEMYRRTGSCTYNPLPIRPKAHDIRSTRTHSDSHTTISRI